MLPPGHVAGGYLLARLVSLAVPALVSPLFFILTAVFAFVPDLDMFVVFAKAKKFVNQEQDTSLHRRFISHSPLVYLAIYIAWLVIFPNSALIAHAFILGTWSHFLLDSFAPAKDSIRWLYPFSKKPYGLNFDEAIVVTEPNFYKHWLDFVHRYTKVFSFKLEVILILLALAVLIL